MKVTINWLERPEKHNYPAAASYLALIFPPAASDGFVRSLERAPVTWFKAKDIFRASGLALLGVSNSHVQKNREKIEKGEKLSPLLLVRSPANGRVIVADGYHRLCSIYGFDENALIPCQIV
jgi:hypothetical protein